MTSMTPTELIEAAARAVHEMELDRFVDRMPIEWVDLSDADRDDYRAVARAAASLIIEACALLVGEFPARQHGNLPIDPHEVAAQVAREIAAGIRSLAPVKEG